MDVMMGHGVVFVDPLSNRPQKSDIFSKNIPRPQSMTSGKRCGYSHVGAKNKLRKALE
jgi:hypothetical protein